MTTRNAIAAALLAAIFCSIVLLLPQRDALGRPLPLSFLLGGAFGVVLQRGRFCFWCNWRDLLEGRGSNGVAAILIALMVGSLGYAAIYGAWLPNPSSGRLPPDAHIGPASLTLALGAAAFGLGMALSGSCISAHLYRLGEGSAGSVISLAGALLGFGLGFVSWNTLYLWDVQSSRPVWFPASIGYGGWLAVQLAALAALLSWAMRGWQGAPAASPWEAVFRRRWPAPVSGILIGLIATIAYLRVGPLGVTAELGSIARTTGTWTGLLPEGLMGLDGLAGCATVVKEAILSRNGVFVAGLVLASFASARLAGDWAPTLPPRAAIPRLLIGGVLMGWGAMVGLGCTVGVILSGTMAGSLSGPIFAAACIAGATGGWLVMRRL